MAVYGKKGNPSLLKIFHVNAIEQVLNEVSDIVLKGVTLYRERTGRKPKPFNGKYCIAYADGTELLADLINCLTGYSFCLKEGEYRYIKIDSINELAVISFYDQTGSIVGPIIRVRKIVNRSGSKNR
ncbi:MAG: hypothetical protein F7B60_05105 [Desulfurococcales archaeon]|nr:hypothetical protein [Desulfurococcales archaeon]